MLFMNWLALLLYDNIESGAPPFGFCISLTYRTLPWTTFESMKNALWITGGFMPVLVEHIGWRTKFIVISAVVPRSKTVQSIRSMLTRRAGETKIKICGRKYILSLRRGEKQGKKI